MMKNVKEVSWLGRLQQDVDVIITWKTIAEMFTIETFLFYFIFICFPPLSISEMKNCF